jgi:hypothetical protein
MPQRIFNAQEWNAASESGARAAEQPEHQVPRHGPGWSHQYAKRNAAMCYMMRRSGTRPRKAVRVLLNNRNTKSLDMVLTGLTSL